MKKLLVITLVLFAIASCKKQASDQLAPEIVVQKQLRDVVLEDTAKDNYYRRSKPFPPGHPHYNPPDDTTQPPPPPPSTDKTVLYLDFDGYNYTGILFGGSVNAAASGLSEVNQRAILDTVIKKFAFNKNITVTRDENVFLSVPKGKRMRCVITSTNFYGNVGGVAYVNSYQWLDDTPCFVFNSLLQNNVHYISGAVPHELGHTLGLRHASVVVNGVVTNEYDPGCCGFAPIMGVPYYQPFFYWRTGYDVTLSWINEIEKMNNNL